MATLEEVQSWPDESLVEVEDVETGVVYIWRLKHQVCRDCLVGSCTDIQFLLGVVPEYRKPGQAGAAFAFNSAIRGLYVPQP